ncbi:hypothetical protein AVEN_94949-1 [Araneus ventricosus]|uniref:Uncharacterized protein n=1 Tax=Araneus ventricosus TaxID=182803 RepID=A0A4Y2DI31_ARAVE|nr:hypothetical protein AVEN_94949-1 [Araneus ventricosus]
MKKQWPSENLLWSKSSSMYQREQILFAIMLTMVKDHVIKYHKKPSPRLALAPVFPLNDWPPRLHRPLWSPHNSPHYKQLMRRLPSHYTGVRPVIRGGP